MPGMLFPDTVLFIIVAAGWRAVGNGADNQKKQQSLPFRQNCN